MKVATLVLFLILNINMIDCINVKTIIKDSIGNDNTNFSITIKAYNIIVC